MNTSANMTREQERDFIEKVRTLHGQASSDCRDRVSGEDHILEGRIIPQQPHAPIALFDIAADYRDIEFYTIAHEAVEVLLRSRDRLIDYYNKQNPQPEPETPFDFARDCGIYCGKPMFQKYMMLVHGLEHPEDRIRMGTKIHFMLDIQSRTQLNTDEAARDRWLSLRAEFIVWKDGRL